MFVNCGHKKFYYVGSRPLSYRWGSSLSTFSTSLKALYVDIYIYIYIYHTCNIQGIYICFMYLTYTCYKYIYKPNMCILIYTPTPKDICNTYSIELAATMCFATMLSPLPVKILFTLAWSFQSKKTCLVNIYASADINNFCPRWRLVWLGGVFWVQCIL